MNVDFKHALLNSGVREKVVQTLEQDEVSLPPNCYKFKFDFLCIKIVGHLVFIRKEFGSF